MASLTDVVKLFAPVGQRKVERSRKTRARASLALARSTAQNGIFARASCYDGAAYFELSCLARMYPQPNWHTVAGISAVAWSCVQWGRVEAIVEHRLLVDMEILSTGMKGSAVANGAMGPRWVGYFSRSCYSTILCQCQL